MRLIYFLFFLLVFSSLYFGMHYFVYRRIVLDISPAPPVSNALKIIFLIGGLSFIAGEILSSRYPVYPVVYFGAVWMGIIAIAFSAFLVRGVIGPLFPGRDKLLTLICIAVTLLASGFSFYNVRRGEILKEINIFTRKLPQGRSPFTIVHLSDMHLDALTTAKWLDSIIDKTNGLNPDLIVITGDLIDADICRIAKFCENLRRLKSRYGVYATTGNHEYYVGIDKFLEVCKNSNIRVLRNEKTTLGGAVELVGIDWYDAWRFSKKTPYLKQALEKCDFNKPVVLLSHQPEAFDGAAAAGVDLQLSGHVHAGQIPPMDALCLLWYKYPAGFYKKVSSFLYTTTGTGTWGPPMRLFSRSEIVKIKIRRLAEGQHPII